MLPGAVVITALSAIYLLVGDVPLVQGLLFGLKAAVLAVVLEALIKVSKRALKNGAAVAIAIAAFVAIAFLKLPFPLIILAAALDRRARAFFRIERSRKRRTMARSCEPLAADAGMDEAELAAGSCRHWLSGSAIWFVPLVALHWAFGGGNVYAVRGDFFSKMAMVTFGGAYAVLAYVAQQAVEIHGWLKPDEMLTGLGLAETTPGPLILVLVFVGFLGGARLSGLDPLTGRPGRRGGHAVVHLRAVLSLDFRRRALCRNGAQHPLAGERACRRHRGGRRHHRQSRGLVRAACAVRQVGEWPIGPFRCRCPTFRPSTLRPQRSPSPPASRLSATR